MKTDNGQNAQAQEANAQFMGAAEIEGQIDRRIYRKTLTPSTMESVPERCITLKRPVMLFRISGDVRGTAREPLTADINKPEDQRQYFTALVGEFEADVYGDDVEKTGEILATYYGGQAYLPTGFHEAVLTQFSNRCDEAAEAGNDPSLQFSLEFAAEPTGNSNTRGYRWIARNLAPVIYDRNSWLNRSREAAVLLRGNRELPSLTQRGGRTAISDQRAAS